MSRSFFRGGCIVCIEYRVLRRLVATYCSLYIILHDGKCALKSHTASFNKLWAFVFSTAMVCRWEHLLTELCAAGFVDLQTEKAELMENVGAIPFLDYKHFASRTFFPEVQNDDIRQSHAVNTLWFTEPLFRSARVPQSDSLMKSCIRDIGQVRCDQQLCFKSYCNATVRR